MQLPDIQLHLRPGIVEFGWGHPNAAVLPTAQIAQAAAHALTSSGSDALAYGAEQGPGRLITGICEHLTKNEGSAPPPEAILITGGISQALEMLCVQLSRPGDVVLVAEPSYHLAQKIFRDHQLKLVGVHGDMQGIDVDGLEAQVRTLRQHGERIAFLYHVATFNNPSGVSLSYERRAALADLARREKLLVLEDDAYAELWYDGPPPPPVYSFAPEGPIVRLGSFAKSLAPGLRLGWMQADPALIQRCVLGGLLDSGGGVNHFTAHVVAAFLELGHYKPHVEHLRDTYRRRRDTLLAALARHLPSSCQWQPVLGGFFIWIRLPDHVDADAMLPLAEAAGVSYLPGSRFYPATGGRHYLRLSLSLLDAESFNTGARRLGEVIEKVKGKR